MPVAGWFLSIRPYWSSNKPPAVASDRCPYCLPIILLASSTKYRVREIVCIYRKVERERSKGTEGESYRFDWTTFLFSSSTGEISLKGCCSLSIGPQGWMLWSQGWRESEWEREVEGFRQREKHRQNSIQLCYRRIRVREITVRNKRRET